MAREIVASLGIVRGIVVCATGIGQGLLGGLQALAGGNVAAYQDVCARARRDESDLLIQHATEVGADAMIGMRYDATEFV